MATNFLKKKWNAIFMANDVTRDGIITLEDADLFAERFAKHHELDSTRAEDLRTSFGKIWQSFFLCGRTRMSPEEYIPEMETEFVDDKNKFCKRMHDNMNELVELFDVNKDGKISEEEFVVVVKCWGIENFDRKFIEKFPQSPKGFIPKDVYRDAWVQFFCNNEQENVKEEKPVLESLGLI